jgi:hypothetical protein
MFKKILSISIVICSTSLFFAQKSNFKTGKTATKNYYTEITYQDVNGKIIIPVIINNETYRFLFDTGAPNLISKALWKKIDSKSVKRLSVTDANQKKQQMDLAIIPSLTIGNITFKETSALVFNGENNLVFDCFEVDGIIGSNLLRQSVVQIKSKEKLLILSNSAKKLNLNKTQASKLMLKGNQSSPYINITLKGLDTGNENLLLDTGASGFYDLCKTNYSIIREKNISKLIATAHGSSSVGLFGVAKNSEQYRLLIPELSINGFSFNNIITTTGNDDNSRIGSDILQYGTITLDFRKKRFYFAPFKTGYDLSEKLFGFSPTIKDKKLVVGFVWDDMLKDKIQFGDEIIEINGIDYQTVNVCDVIAKPSVFKAHDTLTLVIKKAKGTTKKIMVKRKEI